MSEKDQLHATAEERKHAIEGFEKSSDHENALFYCLNQLKCLLPTSSGESDDVVLCRKALIRNAASMLELAGSIHEQGLLVQLYIIGRGLHRSGLVDASIRLFQSAIEMHRGGVFRDESGELSDDSHILMKIWSELALCKRSLDEIEDCIAAWEECLALAVDHSDIAFEKKASLQLAEAYIVKEQYEDAAAECIRVLAINSDLMRASDDDAAPTSSAHEDFSARWRLCVALKSLRLFEPALPEALQLRNFVQTPDHDESSRSDVTKVLRMLGSLHASLGNRKAAIEAYEQAAKSSADDASIHLDLGDAHASSNRALALACYVTASTIAREQRHPRLEVAGRLREADALMMLGRPKDAFEAVREALDASCQAEDSLALESLCMKKEAEVLASERRYAHALYKCEQALRLAMKTDDRELTATLAHQAAILCQHSTSEKELSAALQRLLEAITRLELERRLMSQEGAVFGEHGKLAESYSAIEVVLHKLGERETSLAFAECRRRRHRLLMRNQPPLIPKVSRAGISQKIQEGIRVCEVSVILSSSPPRSVVSYSMCDPGFLLQVTNPDGVVTFSYLLSDHVVDPEMVVKKLAMLIAQLSEASSNPAALYHTEDRSLPARREKAAGDDVTTCSARAKERDRVDDADRDARLECEAALRELYVILVQPMRGALDAVAGRSLCFIADGILAHVPFDSLVSPVAGRPLGERFDVTIAPCLLESDNSSEPRVSVERSGGATREEILLRTYQDPDGLRALQKVGLDKSINGLVSSTSTGSAILASRSCLTNYHQADAMEKARVIGCPSLPARLLGKSDRLSAGLAECEKVARYVESSSLTGSRATKSEFLAQLSSSTLLHICTFADTGRGLLAFTPNDVAAGDDAVAIKKYIVDEDDLMECRPIAAKLIVLSSGHRWGKTITPSSHHLVHSLLYAGARCVVAALWPVPDDVTESFMYNFYKNLQGGGRVSSSVYLAKQATKERYSGTPYWNAYVAMGYDVTINLSEMRAADIHRSIRAIEGHQLSLSPLAEPESASSRPFYELQQCLSRLMADLDMSRDLDVIVFLLGLLEEAIDRITRDENSERTVIVLPRSVSNKRGSKDLLSLLGFDFQTLDKSSLPQETQRAFSGHDQAKMVVFPHWNQNGLLLPAYQSLNGLHDLLASADCVEMTSEILPLDGEQLCALIDLLAVVRHAPRIQLRTSDRGVSGLWMRRRIRSFLHSLGIVSVRSLLVFRKTLRNRSLLVSALHILLSVCQQRDEGLLEKLNMETLGRSPVAGGGISKRFDSISAVTLPGNKMALTAPWPACRDCVEEEERKRLSLQLSSVASRFARVSDHARWWHEEIKLPKATSKTPEATPGPQAVGREKVKVEAGMTPSCQRLVVRNESFTSLYDVLRRRDELRSLIKKRHTNIAKEKSCALRSVYLPYATW